MDLQLLEDEVCKYLQNDCSDFWSTKLIDNVVKCYFAGKYRFSVVYEDEDYYISGTEVPLDIVYGIAVLLKINC